MKVIKNAELYHLVFSDFLGILVHPIKVNELVPFASLKLPNNIFSVGGQLHAARLSSGSDYLCLIMV